MNLEVLSKMNEQCLEEAAELLIGILEGTGELPLSELGCCTASEGAVELNRILRLIEKTIDPFKPFEPVTRFIEACGATSEEGLNRYKRRVR